MRVCHRVMVLHPVGGPNAVIIGSALAYVSLIVLLLIWLPRQSQSQHVLHRPSLAACADQLLFLKLPTKFISKSVCRDHGGIGSYGCHEAGTLQRIQAQACTCLNHCNVLGLNCSEV